MNGYEDQPVGPNSPSNPRDRPKPPFVIPPPSYPLASGPYVAYPGPQRDMKACATSNGHLRYIAEYQSLDICKPKNKTRRGDHQKWQTDLMRQWYEDHIKDPYPTKFEKHEMARKSELSLEQVKRPPSFIPSALDSVH